MKNDDNNLGSKSLGEPKWRFNTFFADAPADLLSKLEILHTELLKANPGLSIIPTKTETDADYLHFADIYLAIKAILAKDKSTTIYDLAPGNVLTGLILALMAPERKVIVLDIDGKKIDFVKQMINSLGISNITAQVGRIEDVAEGVMPSAMIRGPLPITKYLLAMRKPMAADGKLHHLKGNTWAREVGDIPSQICSFWKPELAGEYQLPISGARQAVVTTIKR